MGRRAGDVLYHEMPLLTPLRRGARWRQLLQTKERVDSIPLEWRVKTEQLVETFQVPSALVQLSDGHVIAGRPRGRHRPNKAEMMRD
jgi:hypothetical protein